jgi:hypothetical protein
MIRNTNRPVSVVRSRPSRTEKNAPPARSIRSISPSPWTSERPNRSTVATTKP